jgi:hypothetical protein
VEHETLRRMHHLPTPRHPVPKGAAGQDHATFLEPWTWASQVACALPFLFELGKSIEELDELK